jgi:hypothetical protein
MKPIKRLDGVRVDLDTATREELVAEIVRLDMVVDRWEKGWHQIVEANTTAWLSYVNSRDAEIDRLRGLING